jgi:predicted metal-dependent peptidase
MTLPEELQAARLRLLKGNNARPYLATAAWALQPVETKGLGTLAVDYFWRVYYDPAVCQLWTVEELAGVLYHELSHLLREHPDRMQNYDDHHLANICTDMEINDDIVAEGVKLPGCPVMPETLKQPRNLLAEEYYSLLQEQESAPGQCTAGESANGNSGDNGDGSDSNSGDAGGLKPGDEGEGNKNQATSSSGSNTKQVNLSGGMSSASSEKSASSSSNPSGIAEVGCAGRQEGDRVQIPAPGAGRCGSCATGHQEPWEQGAPTESAPGIGKAEGELIRREVARRIQEHSRSMGNVPGHWKRWAEEKLSPKVNWRRELAAAIRFAVADTAGAVDYSYRRPSRRQASNVVLPALRQPVPQVALVVDTSGSISDTMLSQALAEISGVLKSVGQRDGVRVLSCDTQVTACRRVFRSGQVELTGGGGTDMGKGVEAAAKLRPVPHVCIVITDGYTVWPSVPPKGIKKTIVALTGDGGSPDWAKTVKVEGGR